MAATGYSPIQLYYSTTASAAPTAGNLASGELAINITDGKLYYKDNAGAVQLLSTSTTANGTANGVLYLNGSKVATSGTALVFDGTNLGIGTSSPLAKLDVQGGSIKVKGYTSPNNSDGYSLLSGVTGNIGYIQSYYGNGSAVVGAPLSFDASYFTWRNIDAGYAERMRIDTSGNLGIGTSSPAYKLDVSAAKNTTNIKLTSTGLSSADDYTQLSFGDSSNIYGAVRLGYNDPSTTSASYLAFYNNTGSSTTERMRLDSSGNLGLGVTPSAWASGWPALQVGTGAAVWSTSDGRTSLGSNIFVGSGPTAKYIANGFASSYTQLNGVHSWNIAPNNTSGAGASLTATQAMTLDTSGNLGIGTSSPTSAASTTTLEVANATTARVIVNSTGGRKWGIYTTSSDGRLGIYDYTASADRLIIDSSGNLGLGVTPSAWTPGFAAFQVKNASLSALSNGAYVSANAAYVSGFKYISGGYASSYEQSTGGHYWYTAPSGTAGNAITFTQAMTLDASGNLLVGTTSGSNKLTVNGNAVLLANGQMKFADATNQAVSYITNSGAANTSQLEFWTGATPAERARIDSSGNLLVGQTASGAQNLNGLSIQAPSGYEVWNHVNGTGSGTGYIYFDYNATGIGSITQSGTTAVLYNVTSDQRLKENIVDAPEFGSVIDSIKVRSYDWKADGSHQRAGFVAQELVTVAPEAVHQPADPEEMMAVDYSKLVPMLVKEIQSLRKRLADAGIA